MNTYYWVGILSGIPKWNDIFSDISEFCVVRTVKEALKGNRHKKGSRAAGRYEKPLSNSTWGVLSFRRDKLIPEEWVEDDQMCEEEKDCWRWLQNKKNLEAEVSLGGLEHT